MKVQRQVFRPAQVDGAVRNAVVNFDASLSRSPFAYGYRLAARYLVERVLSDGHNQDFLVGPICFLYRHSAELGLKHIIDQGYALVGRDAGVPDKHGLLQLWRETRALILTVDSSTRPVVKRVNPVIDELHSVDPDGQTFRYTTRDDAPSWPSDLHQIDLQHVAEVMEELANLLEAAGDMMSVNLDWKREWEAEMAQYAEDARDSEPSSREHEPDPREYEDH